VQNEATDHSENRLLSPLGAEGGVKHTLPHVAGAFATYAESPIERLLASMESHATQERESMDDYRRLVETVGDPVVAMLMRLVLEDEERHHALLQRMAVTLHDNLNWTHSSAALPTNAPAAAGQDPKVIQEARETTHAFIDEEREGARYLRKLAHDERDIHGGLFSLLLETMAMDSEKHEHVLRFIQRRLQQQEAESRQAAGGS
jgi:hypothetical protein